MSSRGDQSKAWGQIGGLTAWSRNASEIMLGAARRGFRARFEKLVDPDGVLDPHERSIRADRARRAYMLTLAARSAAARKQKGQTRRIKDPRLAEEDTDATGMHPPPD